MLCLFLTVLRVGQQCVNVTVPGRTHLLFNLTFSIQFLKVMWQEKQKFLWWRPLSFAWVLRGILAMKQTPKWTDNCNILMLSGYFVKLYRLICYQSSGKREYLFLQHYHFWNDSMEMVLLPFKLFLSSTRLCLWDVHQFAKAELFPLMFTSNIYVYHIKSFKCSTFLKRWLMVSMKANVL